MLHKKNHTYLFVLGLVGMVTTTVFFTGCDSLLDQAPRGEQTLATFFEDEGDAIAATNATYQVQRKFAFGFQFFALTDVASDNAVKGSTPADAATLIGSFNDLTFTPSNGSLSACWNVYYDGIFRANQAITNIPDIDMDPELRARLVGENRFLRAFYYFFLVRVFGGVPLVKKPLQPGEFEKPRASAEEIYAFIEQDLKASIQVLPPRSGYAPSEAGRATRGAARGLLAKVHLFQDEFQKAEDLATQVINSGEYALLSDYNTVFSQEGENSVESLYEVQSVALATGGGGNIFSRTQGVRGQPNLGWGFNNPSDNLLAAYEPGDPRLGATIIFVYEWLPEGGVVRDNVNMPGAERYSQKYYLPPSSPGGIGNSGVNIRRLRYADILLTAAEAAYQTGNQGKARRLLNRVRRRARNGQNATIGITVESLPGLLVDTTGISADQINRPFIRYAGEEAPATAAGLKGFTFVPDIEPIVIKNLDIIQSVDGVEINSPEEFHDEMSTKSPGQSVNIEILRVTQIQNGGNISTNTQTLQFTVQTEQLLPDVTASGQALLEAIWHERRIELAMEQKRFFDLRRQGRADEVLGALGINFESRHKLFPIPQEEVVLGGLQQNPGY